MSNYTKATNFATKDNLPTGNALKVVSGVEIDNELNAIAVAVGTKANLAGAAFTGAITTNSTIDGRDVAADGVLATNALPKGGGTMTGVIAGFESTGIDDNSTETAITIDANEHVGIGVVPKAWSTEWDVVDIGIGGSLASNATGTSTRTFLSDNAYNAGGSHSTTWKRKIAEKTSQHEQLDGKHVFRVSATGAADSAISWTDAVTIDNSGNVITTGTSGITSFTGTSSLGITVKGSTAATDYSGIDFKGNNQANPIARIAALTTGGGSKLQFGTSNSYGSGITNTAMTIDFNGNVLVGTTSSIGSGSEGIELRGDLGYINTARNTTNPVFHHKFYNPNGVVGSITTSGSATSYNTSSDHRLKTDVQPMVDATATFMQLNPVSFEWIADGTTRVDGFLAHELGAVIPEAATGTHNGMVDEEYEASPAVLNDEGVETTPAVMATRSVPDYQGIDQSKVVPLLVATLQEALARIEALEV